MLLKGVVVKGFEIRTFPLHKPDLAVQGDKELIDLVETGGLRPYVSAVHPLDDVAAALRSVADRKTTARS